MAPVTGNLLDDLTTDEYQTLVGNRSVDSFIMENKNELTITRDFGGRKYSTMSFKKHEKQENVMDVVITHKNCNYDERDDSLTRHFTSQDIRRKYSTRAKCGVAFVLTMLLVMFVVLVVCLVLNSSSVRGYTEKPALASSSSMQDTMTTVNTTLVIVEVNMTSSVLVESSGILYQP